ncbi:hypothetical protein JYU34_002556 [Plutella xylostella]|uniref:Uncharacterized protein n=1 Tax=Plutella xylostella TaxID=51655 RepID=A0ABQ7R2I1_PLUXY|nr:hypothetical protein JYU34_002556 [Plutella xylostella]
MHSEPDLHFQPHMSSKYGFGLDVVQDTGCDAGPHPCVCVTCYGCDALEGYGFDDLGSGSGPGLPALQAKTLVQAPF